MDFFKYKNKIAPEKGRLLISEPFLPDPNFERTVVLLCDHNDGGSFGFVLNKPSILKIDQVMESIKNIDDIAYIGGPVQQDTLHYIHRCEAINEARPICDGINWGGDFNKLVALNNAREISPNDIRFFLGYSGWGAGQLDSELETDSWIVCDYVTKEFLFNTEPQLMWKKALENMGGRFSVYSNYPVDPRLN